MENLVKSEIKLDPPSVAFDIVYKIQMIWLMGTCYWVEIKCGTDVSTYVR